MKRLKFLALGLLLLWTLNGCSDDNDGDQITTYFLVDKTNTPLSSVSYECYDRETRKSYGSETGSQGEFTFYTGEDCEFDFDRYRGSKANDFIYIIDKNNKGQGGIKYECESGIKSSTFREGDFEYEAGDICTFYL